MKKIFFLITIIIALILSIFLGKTIIKKVKSGNNMSNKSLSEIQEYILNISSYEAEVEIKVISNKNENTYKATQKFVKENNLYRQEIIEPDNIKGIVFSYDGHNLKVENSSFNLTKLYENYNYMGSNNLSLIQFINDYNESETKSIKEKNGLIILETKIENGNKYRETKKLYIRKEDAIPVKMEIQDISQNTLVYILYNKIEINNLQKEDVLAFKLNSFKEDI